MNREQRLAEIQRLELEILRKVGHPAFDSYVEKEVEKLRKEMAEKEKE